MRQTLDLQHLDFGDGRLNRRFLMIVNDLGATPEAGIPEATRSWKGTKATYRFFDNPAVHPDKIRDALRRDALDYLPSEGPILAIQDTTSLDFTAHEATEGLGYLEHPARRGLFLHTTLAVSADGVPCGLLDRRSWTRDSRHRGKAAQRRTRPTREKESGRWLDATEAVEAALPPDREVLTIADREADIYDLFARPRREGSHLLIRIKPCRGVRGPARLLGDAVRASAARGTMSVELGRADDRPPRTAELTIRYAFVAVTPPQNRPQVPRLPDVPLTAILVEELSPPEGQEPVRWWLITTRTVSSLADAEQMVRWYALRWLVERYHFVLKSGCRVERLQLRTFERLDRAIATCSAVAWRLLWLTYQARRHPDGPAAAALSEPELGVLRLLDGAETDPTLRQAVRRVAMLGGFLGRKSDGEPGVKTIWRGLRRLDGMVVGYSLALKVMGQHMRKTRG
jgi:hypothetical protein